MKSIVKFFDKLEDKIRQHLSHKLLVYAFLSGTVVVLFWKGIWDTADFLQAQGGFWAAVFYGPNLIVWTTVVLSLTGVFVSFFVGDRVILSGLKHEKSIEEKTEAELKAEDVEIKNTIFKIHTISKDIEEIKHALHIK